MSKGLPEHAIAEDSAGLAIGRNRASVNYSRSEMLRRVAWMVVRPLFRFSPRPCFGWRRWLLRCLGANVGRDVHVYSSAWIYYPWMITLGDEAAVGEDALIYNLGPVKIGRRTTISHRAHLCAGTHDYRDPELPLKRPPISIGDDAWICADAFIGPNVNVGDGAVVGARAVVFKDVPPWTIVAGNPAVVIKRRALCNEKSTHPDAL